MELLYIRYTRLITSRKLAYKAGDLISCFLNIRKEGKMANKLAEAITLLI